jgi:hypothetical protein
MEDEGVHIFLVFGEDRFVLFKDGSEEVNAAQLSVLVDCLIGHHDLGEELDETVLE